MAEHDTEHMPLEFVVDVGARLGGKRQRLAWAVDFAQTSLDEVLPGRLADIRLELTGLLAWHPGLSSGKEGIRLFSRHEAEDTQREFRRIFATLIRDKQVSIGKYPEADLSIVVRENGPLLLTDLGIIDLSYTKQATYRLALLLGDYGDRVKECHAPRAHGDSGDVCGKWFVGRPNQTYCSRICQNRVTTQNMRQRRTKKSCR